MQDGYISEDGEYKTGSPGIFGSPVLVREGDEDFAEVVSGSTERLFMYGRTHSEVFQEFLSQLTTPEAITQFGRGFISYPDDIRWFLYGVAAYANLLGPEAKGRNTETFQRVSQVFGGDGTPSARMKSAVLFGAYLNHTLMRNAAGFSGRLVGGFTTKLVLQIAANRFGVGFLNPQAYWLERNLPFFLRPMFLIVTAGSVVRLAEKHFDQYGDLQSMSLTDILVSATTGQDTPGDGVRFTQQTGADLANKLSNALMFCDADIREANDVSFGEGTVRADRLTQEIGELRSQAFSIASDLRYASNDDEFFDAIVRAHNIAVKARLMGCAHNGLETFIILMDQTLISCMSLLLEGLNAILESQSGHYEYWNIVIQDFENFKNLNNPEYIEEN
ncbi:hypothetical protein ACMA5I_10900 [Paracoccaceae bacterium GXU_MW_L88]